MSAVSLEELKCEGRGADRVLGVKVQSRREAAVVGAALGQAQGLQKGDFKESPPEKRGVRVQLLTPLGRGQDKGLHVCRHPLDAVATWTMPGPYPRELPRSSSQGRLQR